MKNLASFLEKFKRLKDPKREREEVARLISNCLNTEVTADLIEIKRDSLEIKMRGGMKTEIFMKKDEILKVLKENFPKLHISKIC